MTGPTTNPADTTTELTPVKETPAQRVERVKREKAPWSIMDDIRRYSREGFSAIDNDDLTVRFRAWGLYTQGDGRGTRGDEMPFFMMRVRTPNGLLTSDMVRRISDLSDTYARSSIDITNRQNFQLHWLRIEDIPTIWESLGEVGWTSMGACGDNPRTVTGCSLAGVEHDELIDASPIAVAVDKMLNGNPDYGNLPRKFKITITGCQHWCSYPEINDIGATAVRRADGVVGFHIRVGGGLSTKPHLAVLLPAFVHPHEVPKVVETITAIFRDSDELRVNRTKARMKFLFVNHGWTAESFLTEIERRIGYKLDPLAEDNAPEGHYRDHLGVHPQKQAGLSWAGFSVVSGRISPDQLRGLATLADEFGDGSLRLSAMQNILITNIKTEHAAELVERSRALGVALDGSPFQRGTASCTGSEYCKLALTETKLFSIRLAQELEDRLPGFTDIVKLHVAGCPNSCGQHPIADVGLQGVLLNQGGVQVEGFDFFVGGGLGKNSTLGHRVGFRAPADDVPEVLERLFTSYTSEKLDGESVRAWTGRLGDAGVKAILSGSADIRESGRMTTLTRPIVPTGHRVDAVIGRTPVVRLERVATPEMAEVWIKLEGANPGGSIKDRTALGMILDAEARGVLKPGDTIVEPTSGNTGIGLAQVASARGYRLILCLPDSASDERKRTLEAYGAELVLTDPERRMLAAIEAAEQIRDETGAWLPNQFSNPANPRIHYETTGPELWEQMEGRIDAFVYGSGTGGTITGVGRFLKEQRSDILVIAVEPARSPVLSGGVRGAHQFQGMGPGFIPENLDRSVLDRVIPVWEEDAFPVARRLAREEGLFVGMSSGAIAFAALQVATALGAGKRVAMIAPDTGARYLSTVLFSADDTPDPAAHGVL